MADENQETTNTNEDENKSVDTGDQGVVQSPPKSDDQPPAWFKAYADKVDGKFTQVGKDLGRLRGKVKSEDQQPEQQPAMTRDELLAAQELGRVQAGLTDEANAMIADMLDDGASFRDALRMAKMAKAMAPANGAQNKSPAEPRRQAPSPKAPKHPKSVDEYMALQRKANGGDQSAKDRIEALSQDSTFDLNTLPQYAR